MVLKSDINSYDFIEVGDIVYIHEYVINESKFYPFEEPKWVKHCKKHRFNRFDTHGKIYHQYLLLCAEGLI